MNPQNIIDELHSKAKDTLKNPNLLGDLLELADSKAKKNTKKLDSAKKDFMTLIEMIRRYLDGTYRKIPWRSLITIVATLLYFVNPMDIIPDFVVGAGFLDDISVLAFSMRTIKSDLDDFRREFPERNT